MGFSVGGIATSVSNIIVYPIKSLDGVSVAEATILGSGGLEHDREFALVDEYGKWVNGKRAPRIHRIRAEYDLKALTVRLGAREDVSGESFHLVENRRELEAWFGEFFGFRVRLERNPESGFPDDTESPGPTFVGVKTLDEVGAWFGITDRAEVRRRFRANIEIDAPAAFWEDQLFASEGERIEFQVGEVTVYGVNPCQRCAVPTRHPDTGAVTDNFQKLFADKRASTLPSWAPATRFNHFYRLSVNTCIAASEAGKTLRLHDPVLLTV